MIIFGTITLIVSVLFWCARNGLCVTLSLTPRHRFLFPDSPTNAWFLTPEERIIAVERIKGNQAGVENKHWKREQFIECLKDPKTWLFFFISAIS